ncbi:hypothetical protein K9L27_00470 [Candidatus Gracilibacteria bacterium]|nr:hypothetical protein [Candidatus Gracilibacteria bacterium]
MKSSTMRPAMKYAYLLRNFKKLSFEERVIFLSHAATILFCFFPWISIEPLYDDPYWNSAFSGAGALIGAFIFLTSLLVALFFVDKILETKRILISFPETYIFYATGIEQLIFLILSWSVLISVTRDFESSEIRFGIFACFLVQIAGLSATYLLAQNNQQKKAREFFHHPESPRGEKDLLSKKDEKLGGLFESDASNLIHHDQ